MYHWSLMAQAVLQSTHSRTPDSHTSAVSAELVPLPHIIICLWEKNIETHRRHANLLGIWMRKYKLDGEGYQSAHIVLSFSMKNAELLAKWLANVNRDGTPGKTARLCAKHFTVDCFQEDLYFKYLGQERGEKCKRLLTKDAVPTIFKFNVVVEEPVGKKKYDGERNVKRCKPPVSIF